MHVSAKGWISIGSALGGLLIGFEWGSRRHLPEPSLRQYQGQQNIEYEDSYINAVVFRSGLREQPNLDSLFAHKPFFHQAIRVLRQDSAGIEALSMPRPGTRENYYLIRGDSITQLWLSSKKLR